VVGNPGRVVSQAGRNEWNNTFVMSFTWELAVAVCGLIATVAGTTSWWKYRSSLRAAEESRRLEQSSPKTRDGLLVSALALEIVTEDILKNPTAKGPEWLAELTKQLDSIVTEASLKPAGSFQTTYMVVGTDERVAQISLQKLARLALDLKDHVMLFAMQRELRVWAKFGVHADIIPTVGLGSTVALSELWAQALHLADVAESNAIELSDQAAEWLGAEFDIQKMSGRPVLFGRKSAA
jgi:hypothetical protein